MSTPPDLDHATSGDAALEERVRRALHTVAESTPVTAPADDPVGRVVTPIGSPRDRLRRVPVALRVAASVVVVAAVAVPTALALSGGGPSNHGVTSPGAERQPSSSTGVYGQAAPTPAAGSPSSSAAAGSALRYGRGILKNSPCTITTGGTLSCPGAITVPGVRVQIEVSETNVTAGTPLHATIVVDNTTGRTVQLNDGCGIQAQLALTNATYTPAVAFATPACATGERLRPGVTRFPQPVATTYLECIPPSAVAANPDTRAPVCTGPNGETAPPLPAGRYAVVLVPNQFPLPPAAETPIITVSAHD